MPKSPLSDKEPLDPAPDASLTLEQLDQVAGGFMFGVGALGSSTSESGSSSGGHHHHGHHHNHGHNRHQHPQPLAAQKIV